MVDGKLPPAICLMGPTASGKTDLAIQLCEWIPAEIISVDSAMVYRGMNVGTAKPSAEELRRAPHRLVDICEPEESYSAAQFRLDALAAMAEINAAKRIPLLVGGTMLYFKALLEGLASMPSADPQIRGQIEREAAQRGWPHIHAQLALVDPVAAARIHPNHSQRIERALEVYRISGISMTEWQRRQTDERPPYHFIQLAIAPEDRSVLHERIARRFQQMLEGGLVDEVAKLRARGDLHPDLPSMRSVGYRQVWQCLEGELSEFEMIERGIVATRQLAKRQFTWLRGWPELQWIWTDADGLLANTPGNREAGLVGCPPIDLVKKILNSVSI